MTDFLDRTIAPDFVDFEPFDLIQAKSTNLINGIKVHFVNAGTQPLIRLEFIFFAGTWFEGKPSVSYLTAKMLTEGSKNFTDKQISETLAFYGAFYEVLHNADRIEFVVYCLCDKIDDVLKIVVDILKSPTFPEENLENLKNIAIQGLSVSLEKNSYVASNTFRTALFGAQHPYGVQTTEETIRNVKRDDLVDFHRQYITSTNCQIVASGFCPDNLVELLERYMGDEHWSIKRDNREPSFVNHLSRETHLINRESSIQSSIRIGRKLFTRRHPDYLKFLVLNEILGGYFSSRLMKNIREEKGLTYGIGSGVASFVHEGYFVIATDVKKELTQIALDEIYKEIELLCNENVSESELYAVKNYMYGTFLNSVNTPFSLADKFKTIHFADLNYDYYARYFKTLETITADEIRLTAEKYLNRSNLLQVVVGGLN